VYGPPAVGLLARASSRLINLLGTSRLWPVAFLPTSSSITQPRLHIRLFMLLGTARLWPGVG
jgi:hypothetical protein